MLVFTRYFKELAIDFISSLTKSKGYNILLVIIDYLTNYIYIELIKNNYIAKEIAELIYYS
jgi:hypothetical protein